MRKLLPFFLVTGLLFLGCQDKRVEGVYSFDKKTTLQAYSKQIQTLPKTQRKFAKQGYHALQSLEIMLRLQKGGAAELSVGLKMFEQRSKKIHKGTWVKKGNTILVTTERQRLKGKKIQTYKQTISCAFKPGKLSCSGQSKSNKQKLYFRKT